MSRLTSRDLVRIIVRALPSFACAALISLHVLPQLIVVWWLLLMASVAWSSVMAVREGRRRGP